MSDQQGYYGSILAHLRSEVARADERRRAETAVLDFVNAAYWQGLRDGRRQAEGYIARAFEAGRASGAAEATEAMQHAAEAKVRAALAPILADHARVDIEVAG